MTPSSCSQSLRERKCVVLVVCVVILERALCVALASVPLQAGLVRVALVVFFARPELDTPVGI